MELEGCPESKGLKVNTRKTKVMVSESEGELFKSKIDQRGPITSDPWATLQKHDALRAISNKMSQELKLNKNKFRFTRFEIKQKAKISECKK